MLAPGVALEEIISSCLPVLLVSVQPTLVSTQTNPGIYTTNDAIYTTGSEVLKLQGTEGLDCL